jgi:large subunit ribosomal protein L22
MEVIAKSKYIRLSPKKLNLVAAAIRGLQITEAEKILTYLNKRGSHFLLLVLKQAKANASKNFDLQEKGLKIKKLMVNKGPTYKRGRPVSRGQWHPILKRTSHVTMVLEGEERKEKKEEKEGKENTNNQQNREKKERKEKKENGTKS